jgi:acyl carrier protein
VIRRSQDKHAGLEQRLVQMIMDEFGLAEENIRDESSFESHLGLDSLDLAQLQMAIEIEFKIEILDEDMEKISTVDDALLFIMKAIDKK